MVINQNNSQINSFTKGMNSDTAYDQIDNAQYVFGQNIRITKNQSLGGSADYSSVHEGIVSPVLYGDVAGFFSTDEPCNILSIKTIDDIGVVILNPTGSGDIRVYRFKINNETNEITDQFRKIWTCDNIWEDDAPSKISAVLYKELDNVIKLYIATGEHPIITLRIDDVGIQEYVDSTNGYMNMDKDYLINNRIMPQNRVFIKNIITGRLLTSQVQYTYRYYNKYGNTSQLAPLTNKIQVIDSSRSKEIGNAENTETSIGFMLSINTEDYVDLFNRIQVFRLQYIKPGEDAEVSLIYDDKLDKESDEFILNDVGIDPLQQYTMEEFSAMQGLILIPKTIEQNQEYLFCANVKDDTIIKDLTVQPNNINVVPVKTEVILSTVSDGQIPNTGSDKYSDSNVNIKDGNTNICTVTEYLEQRGIDPQNVKSNYNDLFTSSLLRSLRRGENYKYAIIFYDKYGRRSDVQPLTEDDTQINQDQFFVKAGNTVKAIPYGVKVRIPSINYSDIQNIVGCQIVRRSSSDIYQNTLLQVALSRPVQQGLLDINITDQDQVTEDTVKKSPFYPTGLLTTQNMTIRPAYYDSSDLRGNSALWAKTKNYRLFQAFSSEIDFRRDDSLSKLSYSDLNIVPVLHATSVYGGYINGTRTSDSLYGVTGAVAPVTVSDNDITINRASVEKLTIDKKQSKHWIFNYYSISTPSQSQSVERRIKQVKDIKIAGWNDGFSNIIRNDSDDIHSAIKKYRSFTTNIDSYLYNNWVSFNKYDLRPGNADEPNQDWSDSQESQEFLSRQSYYQTWLNGSDDARNCRNGYIGPGPSCFLISTEGDVAGFNTGSNFQTIICNITHIPKTTDASAKTEQYFGFGNYFPLKYNENNNRLEVVGAPLNHETEMIVFDGDIYITPHEFTTQFKTYNFESIDTLQGTQVTNYIPLESKVNTYFDYGMNLMNTQSANLLYEPGSIDGVTTQERPLHQYNMIYSDNDASNDVFTLLVTDQNETNNFRQRAYYSQLKTNGEFIDNFLIFKPAQFIDVDSRYGEITNMLTDRNTLYYWQDNAFGRFSVNERSLVNDQNSNTIMLGQAGILSRYDYMSTKYGMRLYDFCAKSTENGLFWVDINNKAIVGKTDDQVINFGERTGVQNIINQNITTNVPEVDYDIQNDELLCKCFGNDQIVFNLKYSIATAIYTRYYKKMFYIKNHLYSMYNLQYDTQYFVEKCNYMSHNDKCTYLTPIKLEFIVNPSASVTKVFDSQQIVPIKMSDEGSSEFMDGLQLSFQTDIYAKDSYSVDSYTDREGNIIYSIPRYNNEMYGYRMRGKWMKVGINKSQPDDLFTISHVITKFRQSFS